MYGKFYPWQIVGQCGNEPLYLKLSLGFDKLAVVNDCFEVLSVTDFCKQEFGKKN